MAKNQIPTRDEIGEEFHVIYDAFTKRIETETKKIEKLRDACDHDCECKVDIKAAQKMRQGSRVALRAIAGIKAGE